jgi:hypothetical protein
MKKFELLKDKMETCNNHMPEAGFFTAVGIARGGALLLLSNIYIPVWIRVLASFEGFVQFRVFSHKPLPWN